MDDLAPGRTERTLPDPGERAPGNPMARRRPARKVPGPNMPQGDEAGADKVAPEAEAEHLLDVLA